MSVKKLFENVMDYPDDSKLAQIGNAPAKQSSNATEFKFVHPSVTKSRSKEIAIEIWNIVPSVE